jgi:hypothetical protein
LTCAAREPAAAHRTREACRLVGATLLPSIAASNGNMPDPFNANLRPHEILRRSQRASRVTRPMPATASFPRPVRDPDRLVDSSTDRSDAPCDYEQHDPDVVALTNGGSTRRRTIDESPPTGRSAHRQALELLMTTKAAFNAEDWSVVTNAPFLTAMLVIAADRGGTVREAMAISRAYADARKEPSGELLQAVLSTPPAIDPATAPRTPEDLRREAPATLRQAVGILERHATEDEVIAYKRFVFSLADTVARAHREGGFLGLGGTEISDHEQEALDEIAAIFDEAQSA